MIHHVDKQLVCRQFRRAAGSYDAQAMIQQRAGDRLLDLLAMHGGSQPQRVLEIGCGTGLLTRSLIRRISGIRELVLNDLVPDFAVCAALAPAAAFLPGDIESVPLPGSFDLIISSSALHWLRDLDRLLAKLAASLNPGGILAYSLYGPDNLREIRELTGIGLDYLSLPEIETMIGRYFTLAHSSEEWEYLHFAAPQDVLSHLRRTGVNALSRRPWTRAALHCFCNEYRRRFSAGQGVRLTCHPLYFVACGRPG